MGSGKVAPAFLAPSLDRGEDDLGERRRDEDGEHGTYTNQTICVSRLIFRMENSSRGSDRRDELDRYRKS